jgi:hypothetical protein
MTEMETYVSPKARSLKLKIGGGRKPIQFVEGEFRTDDPEVIAFLDESIKLPHVSQLVRKVDVAEAERISKSYQRQAAAVKGPFTAEHAAAPARQALEARDAELLASGADAASLAKMREELNEQGLMLTESVDPEKTAVKADDGFIPESRQTPAENAQVKNMLGLGKKAE